MSPVESSLVRSAPLADQIFAQSTVRRRSRLHFRAITALGNRSLKIHVLMVAALFVAWQAFESAALILIVGGVVFFVGSLAIARNESHATPLLLTPLSWWFCWQALTL